MAQTPESEGQAIMADTQRSAMESAASSVEPPLEPIKPGTFNALVQVLGEAMEKLSGGEQPAPELPEVTEPLESLPTEIIALVVMIAAFTGQLPEAAPYAFDPNEALSTNKTITELTTTLGRMGADAKLAKAIAAGGATSGPPAKAKPPTKPPAEKPAAGKPVTYEMDANERKVARKGGPPVDDLV